MISPSPDLSLVIACYNEESILERSTSDVFLVLDALRLNAEVIFVNDASRDRTSEFIDRIIAQNPGRSLRKIDHVLNVGRGGSVSDGIRAAGGRFVGFIDIDLEVGAQYILPCLLALEQGYDVATALRMHKLHIRWLHRYVMSHGYRALLKWRLNLPLSDTETGYKFFRRDQILPVLDSVRDQGWFWDTEIMVQAHLAGLRIIEIPAVYRRRTDKVTSVKLLRDSLQHVRKLQELSRVVSRSKDKVRR